MTETNVFPLATHAKVDRPLSHDHALVEDVARVGINYRFGPSSDVVAAKYQAGQAAGWKRGEARSSHRSQDFGARMRPAKLCHVAHSYWPSLLRCSIV